MTDITNEKVRIIVIIIINNNNETVT